MPEQQIDFVPERPARGKFAGWQTVALVITTWIVSTAVNWGVVQSRQEEMTRRQNAADAAISQQVPRVEYDGWRQEIDRRLDRMEQKIDTLLVKR